MGQYTYKSNFDPHDNTEKITGVGEGGDEDLLLGGKAKVVSDEQYATLSTRYDLQPEGSSSEQEVAPGVQAPTKAEKVETATSETTNDLATAPPSGRSKGRQS